MTNKKLPDGHVEVRITKMGHGKVSTGEQINYKDVNFSWKDIAVLPHHIALALEKRGYGEIEE